MTKVFPKSNYNPPVFAKVSSFTVSNSGSVSLLPPYYAELCTKSNVMLCVAVALLEVCEESNPMVSNVWDDIGKPVGEFRSSLYLR